MLETGQLEEILERHDRDPANIIAILQDIQAEVNWLPEEDLRYICAALSIPHSKMMGLATFYKAFSLAPRGQHIVQLCLGTACHVRGAVRIQGAVERELGILAGETDSTLQWTLETVGCLGACALGPIVVIDGEYHGQMTSAKASRLLQRIKKADGNGAGAHEPARAEN
ncbi:MAG: NAD(P)H-dependent oxidoreductase subunit E [Anaerolineae bacterium]|jgi:NADH-quinone oxidoreductase subunit E